MKIAITGGTGFVGSHLARSLADKEHRIVLISRGFDKRNEDIQRIKRAEFVPVGTADEEKLFQALLGCDAVALCAGINRQIHPDDYKQIHVEGTRNVINAAKRACIKKVIVISFYTARPNCGSLYHESKFAAEEIVRNSGLDYTIFKAGMIYGKGDHMLDHLSHIFYTMPIFALVGFTEKYASPLAVKDLVRVLEATLIEGRLSRQTVAIIGPEKLTLEQAVKRVAKVVDKSPIIFSMPVFFHYGLARIFEAVMKIPLVSVAQVRILSEGFDKPYGECQTLPKDLLPTYMFTEEQIKDGLPEPGPFTLKDLRCCI